MDIFDFLILIIKIIDSYLVPLIFAVAFVVFLYGIYSYFIAGAGNDEKRETGRKYALYGIFGFVIIIAIWGIVNLLISSLGFDTKSRPPIPGFGTPTQQGTNTTNPLPTAPPTTGGGTNPPSTGSGGSSVQLLENGSLCTQNGQCRSGYCNKDGSAGICQVLDEA